MTHNLRNQTFLSMIVLSLLALTACNLPKSNSASTPTPNVTQAYQTVFAKMTLTAGITPSPQVTPSQTVNMTPTSTSAPTALILTATPTIPVTPATSAPGCDLIAPGNPIDVTILDDTQLTPGQPFTKTWRLVNNGTCTWTTSYQLAFFSGESMGALAVNPLPRDVHPGESVEVSADLIAPMNPGVYQGNWKLRNPSGGLFGIGANADAAFWVRIVVVASTAVTSTSSVSTLTATPTPAVLVSTTAILVPGNKINLNNGLVFNGEGGDMFYETGTDGKHRLNAVGNVVMGVYGNNPPTFDNCRSAALGVTSYAIEDLPALTYLCYRTSLGLPGKVLIKSYNPTDSSLVLELVTWSVP